jgi:hypothetical protein
MESGDTGGVLPEQCGTGELRLLAVTDEPQGQATPSSPIRFLNCSPHLIRHGVFMYVRLVLLNWCRLRAKIGE